MSAAFYYYPNSGGALETLAISSGAGAVSRIKPGHPHIMSSSEAGDGRYYTVHHGRRELVEVELKVRGNTAGEVLRRDLESLLNHLKRGLSCGFARDVDKGIAWYLSTRPVGGDTTLQFGSYIAHTSSPTISDGDELVVESFYPDDKREEIVSAGSLTTSSSIATVERSGSDSAGVRFDHDAEGMVRHRDYYPVLYMEPRAVEEARQVITERRFIYTVTLRFRVGLAALADLYDDTPTQNIISISTTPFEDPDANPDALLAALGTGGGFFPDTAAAVGEP